MVRWLVLMSFGMLYIDGFASESAGSFWREIDYLEKNGSVIEASARANSEVLPADNTALDHNEAMSAVEESDPFVFKIHGILLKNGTVKIKKNEKWILSYLNQSGGVLDIEGTLILKIKDKMQQERSLLKRMKGWRWKGEETPLALLKESPINPSVDPLDCCIHFSHVIMHPDGEIIFPESLLGKMQSFFK